MAVHDTPHQQLLLLLKFPIFRREKTISGVMRMRQYDLTHSIIIVMILLSMEMEDEAYTFNAAIKSRFRGSTLLLELAFLSTENTTVLMKFVLSVDDFRVAMLTVRVKKFIQRTGRNMDFKEKRPVSLDKSKIECYNCHRKGHFARECSFGRSQRRIPYGKNNRNNNRNNAQTTKSSSQALVAQDGLGGYN
ncbi:ribonuclease H-like domain-containing protein [Tanacetum coccineum]